MWIASIGFPITDLTMAVSWISLFPLTVNNEDYKLSGNYGIFWKLLLRKLSSTNRSKEERDFSSGIILWDKELQRRTHRPSIF
jgi:hypothetical protein